MVLTPLTGVQQATVLALVEAQRLDVVPPGTARGTSFLREAQERLDQLPLLPGVVLRYGIAYGACLDTGEALPGVHDLLIAAVRGLAAAGHERGAQLADSTPSRRSRRPTGSVVEDR
jgi:hypothetical protein